jgi:hypothetical protein
VEDDNGDEETDRGIKVESPVAVASAIEEG